MRYWLLAGLPDSRFSEHLRRSLSTLQAGPYDTQTVVVEGPQHFGHFQGALQQERPGVVPFLETGLAHIRKRARPGDWFVRVDSDDWYGSSYLRRVDEERQLGAVATGIREPYVVTESGDLYWGSETKESISGFGGTLAGSVFECPDFVEGEEPWGEDHRWVQQILAQGKTYSLRDTQGYAWARWEDHEHTFPFPGECLLHLYGWDVYSLGAHSLEKIDRPPQPQGTKLEDDPEQIARIFSIFRKLRSGV